MRNGCWVLVGEPREDEAPLGLSHKAGQLTSPSLHLLLCRMAVSIDSASLVLSVETMQVR